MKKRYVIYTIIPVPTTGHISLSTCFACQLPAGWGPLKVAPSSLESFSEQAALVHYVVAGSAVASLQIKLTQQIKIRLTFLFLFFHIQGKGRC